MGGYIRAPDFRKLPHGPQYVALVLGILVISCGGGVLNASGKGIFTASLPYTNTDPDLRTPLNQGKEGEGPN